MAQKINAGETKYKRKEHIEIDPTEVLFDDEVNGRWRPVDNDEIVKLAKSILDEGQIQPCAGRKRPDKDDRVEIVAGFTRVKACLLLRLGSEGFANHMNIEGENLDALNASIKNRFELSDDAEVSIEEHEDFGVKVIVGDLSPEDAMVQNIVENRQRRGTSPVDDAANAARLRRIGKDEQTIRRIMDISPSWLAKLTQIVTLPDWIKELLHTRSISVDGAIDLLKLEPHEQKEVVLESIEGHREAATVFGFGESDTFDDSIEDIRKRLFHGGESLANEKPIEGKGFEEAKKPKIDKKALKKKTDEKLQEKGKTVKVTLAGLRKLFEEVYKDSDDVRVREAAVGVIKVIKGQHGHKGFANAIVRACEMELEEAGGKK
jgi:ParB-like chromosome segregation protein Spo0J